MFKFLQQFSLISLIKQLTIENIYNSEIEEMQFP